MGTKGVPLTNSDRSFVGFLGRQVWIHSFTPLSSIHPFLWKETLTDSGTTRSLGVLTPLKITFGGSFLPSAATAKVTVKLLFSAPHNFTGTVRLPLNSRVRLDGISNRMGVSSMLKILLKEYPWRWRAEIMNRWNCIIFSSRSFGRRWASVVFVRSVMEWRRFQLTYQPTYTDALNSGSLQNSFAFNRNISPLTAIPKTSKMWN